MKANTHWGHSQSLPQALQVHNPVLPGLHSDFTKGFVSGKDSVTVGLCHRKFLEPFEKGGRGHPSPRLSIGTERLVELHKGQTYCGCKAQLTFPFGSYSSSGKNIAFSYAFHFPPPGKVERPIFKETHTHTQKCCQPKVGSAPDT